jgi:hypothetical protein
MKNYFTVLVFILTLAHSALAADKPLGVEEFSSVEELALSLSSYFPKVQGEVKTVQGDRLTLSLAKKDGLIPGMVLTLWRDGREILHPVTKAVIGRAEDEVGTVEVISVGDASSTAAIKKKLKDARQGDRARITPRKINLAIVPLQAEYPDVVKSLGERLNEFGRFNVLDQAKADAFLKNSKTMGTLVVRELGKAFGLDAVISLGLYPSDGKLMTTARIFYTDDASQLDTVVAMLDLTKTRKEPAAEVKPFFTPVREQRTVTPELPILSKFFTSGDFDGDGKLEYAFSDGERVQVYRNEPSGWREVWTETVTGGDKGAVIMEWQGLSAEKQSALTLQHINLDSADINGNGRPEMFVTALASGKVISSVIEFKDGTYSRTAQVPGFLRTASDPRRGTILLGQSYEPVAFYSGPVKQYLWADGKYVPGEELRLPKGTPLYGWTFANVGEANPLLIVLDDDDHLLIYSQDSLIWKSAEEYPVVANYVFRPATGIGAVLSKQSDMDKSQRMRLRGRVLAADVNADGKDEIVLPKNTASAFMGGLSGAELLGFGWTGMRLDPVWSVKDIAGPVIDLRYGRDGSGSQVSALVRTKGGLFTKDRQQMMIYGLK